MTEFLPERLRRGGIEFVDPFAALQTSSTAASAWWSAQNRRAEAELRSNPLYESVVARLAQGPAFKTAPVHANGRWFRLAPGKALPVVEVSERPCGPAQILFDPATDPDGPLALQLVPSPDGRLVAVVLASRASGPGVVRIVDAATGRPLADRCPLNAGALAPRPLAWLPDASAFFYAACVDQHTLDKRLYRHEVGQQSADQDQQVELDDIAIEPQVSGDGRYLLVLSRAISAPHPIWLKELDGAGDWRPFLPELERRCRGVFSGDRYVAVTTEGADRGRLVSIPIATPGDRTSWEELVPEGRGVMWSVCSAGDDLVLAEIDDATMRMRVIASDGSELAQVPSPGPGAVGLASPARIPGGDVVAVGSSTLVFAHQSPVSSPAVYRYDLHDGRLDLLDPPTQTFPHFTMRRISCRADDGTLLPMQLTCRNDLNLEEPNPVLLTAYGGLGVADLPACVTAFSPFIEAGGIFVWATIRGGGEFGERWRRQGGHCRKDVHYNDFCRAAEHLIESGTTTADLLGIQGVSNGGLLVSGALVRRPELFRAAVVLVPVADLMRYDEDALPRRLLKPEWGDPDDVDAAAALFASSPYHRVQDGTIYPATLAIVADRDDMTPSWHGRKLAARLQQASAGGTVLLRTWQGFGHLEAAAAPPSHAGEWLAFLMQQLGMSS